MEKLSPPLRYGLFAGVSTLALMLIAYALDPRLMLSPGVVWGSLLFYLYFMARAIRESALAWQGEGRVPFQTLLRPAFQVYLVATVLYYAFYYLMFNVFDPGLAVIQKTMVLEQLDQMSGLFGQERVEDMKRALEADDLRVTFSRIMTSLLQSLIGGFLLSLIVAGIMRSRY